MIKVIIVLFLATWIILSCTKETGLQRENKPPIAIAGPDQIHYWRTNTIQLDGIGIDADGSISGFKWNGLTQSNFQYTIETPSKSKTYVTDLVPGTYEFLLTVNDNKGATSTDTVKITVLDTLTTSGKEYIFNEQLWASYYDDVTERFLNVIVISDRLFYDREKKIEVSVLIPNTTNWQIINKASTPTSPGMSYSAGGTYLYIFNSFQAFSENLNGTKASIKIKFL